MHGGPHIDRPYSMSSLTGEDIQCIHQIADNLEACEKRHWLQSEITSTLIAIISEQSFTVQLFFGRVGFTGTSFETLPTAAGVRVALTQYEHDQKTEQLVALRQKWEKLTAVQPPDDVAKKFDRMRDFWDYCHAQTLVDEGKKQSASTGLSRSFSNARGRSTAGERRCQRPPVITFLASSNSLYIFQQQTWLRRNGIQRGLVTNLFAHQTVTLLTCNIARRCGRVSLSAPADLAISSPASPGSEGRPP